MTYSFRINLDPDEIPRYWHNLIPELPEPLPDPIPEIGEKPNREKVLKMFSSILTKEVIWQEYAPVERIRIPDEVIDYYLQIGRPTPLYRARRLEEYLKTPARIYFKREDILPTGSFKINTVIAQLYYAKREGFETIVDCTGAGQTGSAVAAVARAMGMKCKIFHVRAKSKQAPYRAMFMKIVGADYSQSPSPETELGMKYYEQNPDHPGDLGLCTLEASEWAMKHKAYQVQGSLYNFVMTQQSIIGLETKKQLDMIDEKPDVLISCIGGGSNFMGLIIPFVSEVLKKKASYEFIGVRPSTCAPEVYGEYRYDLLSRGTRGPLYKMYTLGAEKDLPVLVAEGLRYHGSSWMLSYLVHKGVVKVKAIDEIEALKAGALVMSLENFIPAPESSYAIKVAIDEALKAKETGEDKVIVAEISGNGFLDLEAWGKKLGL
jgi:tryptophan synthase beta chain